MSTPFLATEKGTIRKKWTGRFPVALLYPNTYPLAVSNLGYQIVYSLLNGYEEIVCERFVYPSRQEPLRSLESNRPLTDFPFIFASISFEDDYPRLVAMLTASGADPLSSSRGSEVGAGSPLVILGGVAVFMNPEPLASFADIMAIGEAEPFLPGLLEVMRDFREKGVVRHAFLERAARSVEGCYVPSLYTFYYTAEGAVDTVTKAPGAPERVRKVIAREMNKASHSYLLSPEAELSMFMTELGRGCSRGCRFCAAGFIYRPPRLWDAETVLRGLSERPEELKRVGLLGMEMADRDVLERVSEYLGENFCSLSFSSLRADCISGRLLTLLSESGLKSAAIAPDGCSERLRRVINKGLSEDDLMTAGINLVASGIVQLKLYVMVGLPTETEDDLQEMVDFIRRLQAQILPLGRKRGRVCTILLSINSFVPKPWTPFQHLSYGGLVSQSGSAAADENEAVMALKNKIRYLRKGLAGLDNLRIKADRPERVLQQAVYARGDRRLAPVLFDIGVHGLSFKKAMKKHGLTAWEYAIRPRNMGETFCWDIIDHSIRKEYLRLEYEKSMKEKPTVSCDVAVCKRCGVCNEENPA